MDKIELARKALLDTIGTGVSFPCSLSGYGGGACGDGYTSDDEELYLSREELLYLISDGSEVFNGLEVKKVDIEARLEGMAEEACWQDGRDMDDGYYDDDENEEDDEDYEDSWSYSGESIVLDEYVDSWKLLINRILSGEVGEADLEKWLAYFKTPDEWEYGIESFIEDNLDD